MDCGWANIKERLAIRDSAQEEFERRMMDFAAMAMLQAYQGSPEFGEDASEYCRNQGWREP